MVKPFFNLILSASLILLAIATIIYANKPKLINKEAAKLVGKHIGEVQVYEDNKGNLKYAQGNCKRDSDCTPAGCSKQVCSSDPNLITTCEVRSDFPDIFVYTCGCVKEKCAWLIE